MDSPDVELTSTLDPNHPDFLFHQFSKEASELYWPSSIQRIACPSPLTFYRDYVATNTPVILTGLLDSWGARAKWNIDYLSQFSGPVSIDITPDGHGDCVVQDKYFVQPQQVLMPFGDFVDVIAKKKPAHGVHYLQKQNDNFRVEFQSSSLWSDIPSNVLDWGSDVFGSAPEAINIWMGDDQAFSSLHKDHYENIYCVVKGQKNFTLCPPADILYLHQREYIPAHYVFQEDVKEWGIELDETDDLTPWIPANPSLLGDYMKWPKLKYTSPLTVEVKAGEVLYIPSLNYHQVGQVGGDDKMTIAINYWWDMKYDLKYNVFKLFENFANKKS